MPEHRAIEPNYRILSPNGTTHPLPVVLTTGKR